MSILDEIEKMSNPELEALKERTLRQQQAQAIGSAASSIAPGLIGMLVGGTNDFRARQFDKGNQIAEATGKQFVDNQKNLKEVMLDGQPRYVTGQEALYEQPYVKPTGLGGAGGKLFAPFQLKNEKTGELKWVQPRDGILEDMATREPITDFTGWKRYERNLFRQRKNAKGDVTLVEVDPITGLDKARYSDAGYGTLYDVATEGQGKALEDQMKSASEKIFDSEIKFASLDDAEKILSTSYDPRTVSATIYSVARDLEPKGVLTNQDFEVLTGQSLDSFLSNIDYYTRNKMFGEVDKYAKSFIGLIRAMKAKKRSEIDTMRRLIPSGGPRSKAGTKLKDVVPKKPEASIENKKAFADIEKRASEKIKDKALREEFLNKKRKQLGL